jgi:uncharacterized membrane protein (DUF4010 family)
MGSLLGVTGAFLPGLGLALGIGLLVGIERGWRMREEQPGARVAGVRTFTLLGLVGGLAGLELAGPLRVVTAILATAAAVTLIIGYFLDARRDGNVSATSAIAGLVTILLGAIAANGQMALASVGAGATVVLLALREPMHRALSETKPSEIKALVRLVLVVLVILPLLPNADLGPYGLNPRRLWTVVVITGGVSFVGYVLVRLLGGRRGALATAVVGALVSSTAVTLECSRRIRADESVHANQAAIVVASGIMMLRATFLVAVLTPAILGRFTVLVAPALVLTAIGSVALVLRTRLDAGSLAPETIRPPDLKLALLFGGLVLLMALAAGWAEQQLRGSGAAVVAVGGMFDVDSAIAALGALPAGTLSLRLAAFAVAVPAVVNSMLKAGLALAIAGWRKGWLPASGLTIPAASIVAAILISLF